MKKIKAAVNKESNVVIAGAGLVGLKAAEGLYGKVKNITVIDLADRIMASVLDEEPAKIIQNHIESKGISFKFGVSIKSVRGKKITLSNGKDLPCDILIIAVGVRPGIAFLEGSGVKVEKGIVVDKNMQTSVKSVYAAGDCALSTDMLSKQKKVMALWPNAVLQGQVAGLNMADVKSEAADALSMNAISFFGMQVMSAGIQEPKAHYLKNTKNALSRLKVNKDILEGFTLINNVARAGIYTDLIKNKTSLSALTYDIKIKDIALGVYPFETRRKKLFGGGAQ
jgi:NADPH-dependent 2,4-dienoyl-CoA reductase/sulfur reductase-like enzyme